MNQNRNTNTFSRSEFRSLVVTIAIIVLGVLIPPYASRLASSPTPPVINLEFAAEQDTQIAVEAHYPVMHVRQKANHIEKASQSTATPIDINSADSLEWKRLPGIGNVLSKRIVKFRDKLGGFYSIEQVSQTYGLEPQVFQRIKPKLIIRTPHQRFTCDSLLTVRKLAQHPYISWTQAERLYKICNSKDSVTMQDLYAAGDSTWALRIGDYFAL